MDIATARRLKAEWYRHGLHNAAVRGEHRVPADELRRLVRSYQAMLFDALEQAAPGFDERDVDL